MFPRSSTHFTGKRKALQERWNAPAVPSIDMGFLQSWLDIDSDLEDGHCTTWGAIGGLALSIAVSASFWAGVAWTVSRVGR
jgi:hypothetical protein